MSSKITTERYEDIIANVLIDSREKTRIDYALKQYAKLNPVVMQLDYGDYAFVGKNGVIVVFEYKTGSDFLNSINSENNHLHNQVYELVTNYDYTFVIVECEDIRDELNELHFSCGVDMSLKQVNGAIAEYCTVSTVLWTHTQYQAFDLMFRVAAKIIQQKPYRYKFGKKSTNAALNYLSAIKGLDKRAEEICRQLNLHSLNDLLNLNIEKLTSVKGIGKKKAEMILNQIHGK